MAEGSRRFEEVAALRQAVVRSGNGTGWRRFWLRFHDIVPASGASVPRATGSGRRRSAMPPSRSASTRRRLKLRDDGWAGGSIAPIN